jgi:hypothetical protein
MKWLTLTMLVSAALLLPIFGIPGGWGGIQAALLILLIGFTAMIMGTLIFALIMGNRLPMAFKVDAEGVNMKSVSSRVKNINRGAILVGLLARKPGVIGAGMAGRSQEETTIPWNELRKVDFYPAHRVIFLKGDIFSRIRLYCTPANYSAVEQCIRKQLSAGTTVKVF